MSYLRTLPIAAFATLITLTGCQTMSSNQNGSDINHSAHSAETVKQVEKSDLVAYTWHLVKATDKQNNPIKSLNSLKDDVYIKFNAQKDVNNISFSAGCNAMRAGYTLESNVMEVGQIVSTAMLCLDKEQSDAENHIVNSVGGISKLSYTSGDKPTLKQVNENGNTLVWQGKQTPEARYGQSGDIVFWEIDNEQQMCPDGSAQTCLKVRPVYYDDKGIKTGYGDWDLFVGEIEGYTHDSSLEQIVRLKRFVVDPADVKGKQFVYVFDMAVESGVVEDM